MAKMGLKYLKWAEIAAETDAAAPTYKTAAVELGKMVSLNVTVKINEAELRANDMVAEYAAEFDSADMSADVDNISLENQAKLYGATYSSTDGLSVGAEDIAPYGGFSGYQVLMINGVKTYRGWFFPKARAIIPDLEGATKGQNLSFGTQPIKAKILAPKYGPWYKAKDFDTEAAAKTWADSAVAAG